MNNLLPPKEVTNCEICTDELTFGYNAEKGDTLCNSCRELKDQMDNMLVQHGAIVLIKAIAHSFKGCESASELYEIGDALLEQVKKIE